MEKDGGLGFSVSSWWVWLPSTAGGCDFRRRKRLVGMASVCVSGCQWSWFLSVGMASVSVGGWWALLPLPLSVVGHGGVDGHHGSS